MCPEVKNEERSRIVFSDFYRPRLSLHPESLPPTGQNSDPSFCSMDKTLIARNSNLAAPLKKTQFLDLGSDLQSVCH